MDLRTTVRVRLRWAALALAAVVLVGCSAAADADPPGTTTGTAVTASGTAAPPEAPALLLRVDGLGSSDFGRDQASVEAEVTAALGPPRPEGSKPPFVCSTPPGTAVDAVEYGNLMVTFIDGTLAGWNVLDPELAERPAVDVATADGLRVGDPLPAGTPSPDSSGGVEVEWREESFLRVAVRVADGGTAPEVFVMGARQRDRGTCIWQDSLMEGCREGTGLAPENCRPGTPLVADWNGWTAPCEELLTVDEIERAMALPVSLDLATSLADVECRYLSADGGAPVQLRWRPGLSVDVLGRTDDGLSRPTTVFGVPALEGGDGPLLWWTLQLDDGVVTIWLDTSLPDRVAVPEPSAAAMDLLALVACRLDGRGVRGGALIRRCVVPRR